MGARQFLMQKPSKAANDVLALFGGAPVMTSSKQKNQTEGKPWWAKAASGTRETAASKPVPAAACCSPSLRFAEAKRRAILSCSSSDRVCTRGRAAWGNRSIRRLREVVLVD